MDAIYSSPSLSGSEIRLVWLRPPEGPELDTISCDLSVGDLNAELAFVALSYAWGDAKITEEIFVNGVSFKATVNLVAYLKQRRELRDSGDDMHTLPIWIDAICINQSDVQEKNRQLPLMRNIYQKAKKVIAWIGEPDDDDAILEDQPPTKSHKNEQLQLMRKLHQKSKKAVAWIWKLNRNVTIPKDEFSQLSKSSGRFTSALALVEDIGKRGDFDGASRPDHWINQSPYRETLCEPDYASSSTATQENAFRNTTWIAFSQIFRRKYWYRAWTLQELALPAIQDVFVQCGLATFEYAAILEFTEFVRETYINKPACMQRSDWLELRSSSLMLNKKTLATRSFISRVFRNNVYNIVPLKYRVSVIQWMGDFGASDARDSIYATLGITKLPIKADYTKTVREVYTEVTTLALPHLFAHILCNSNVGHLLGPDNETLPSWVPDWGSSATTNNMYCTAGLLNELEDSTWEKPLVEGDRLHLPIVYCDTIEIVINFDNGEDLPRLLLRYLTCVDNPPPYRTGVSMAQAVLRTLVLDEDHVKHSSEAEKLDPANGYFRPNLFGLLLCLGSFWDSKESETFLHEQGVSDNESLLTWFNCNVMRSGTEVTDPGSTVADHLVIVDSLSQSGVDHLMDACMSTLDEFHAFETKSGYIGLGPKGIKAGDTVVVPLRHKTPTAIRKEDDHHIHVGTCFVLGLMDGEAIELVRQGKRKVEVYDIH